MSDPREISRQLRRERIATARRRHPLDKALAGPELYDQVLDRMAWGVQMEFPDADEAELRRIVLQRLAQRAARKGLR